MYQFGNQMFQNRNTAVTSGCRLFQENVYISNQVNSLKKRYNFRKYVVENL